MPPKRTPNPLDGGRPRIYRQRLSVRFSVWFTEEQREGLVARLGRQPTAADVRELALGDGDAAP